MPSRWASRLHQRRYQLMPLLLARSGEQFAAWQQAVESFSSRPSEAAWRAALARAEGALSLSLVQKEADSVQGRTRQVLGGAPAAERDEGVGGGCGTTKGAIGSFAGGFGGEYCSTGLRTGTLVEGGRIGS